MIRWLGLALLLLPIPAFGEAISGDVIKVYDGDTLTLADGQRVRVFAIDAPELNQQCKRDGACVPCGKESRDTLEAVAVGSLVCENRGKSYNRVVGRCYAEGVDLALKMLHAGQAMVYQQYIGKRDPLREAYLEAEAKARAAGLGIWAGDFIRPEDWRHHKARLECER